MTILLFSLRTSISLGNAFLAGAFLGNGIDTTPFIPLRHSAIMILAFSPDLFAAPQAI